MIHKERTNGVDQGETGELRRGVTREQARKRLFEIIVENTHVEASSLRDGATLREDLNFDSLDLIAVVNEVEHEWTVVLPDGDTSEVQTVEEMVDVLWEALLGEADS
ncbi:acyl carrier protein [Planctomycetota bacterium]